MRSTLSEMEFSFKLFRKNEGGGKCTNPEHVAPHPDMTPTALTTLPHIPSSTGSELGIIPDMNSPVTRTLERETAPQTTCQSRDQSHDSPDPCSQESEEVSRREMLSECLLEDDEFGEDWVLESRPLSFSED